MFNVIRNVGTDTRRISAIPGYSVPFSLPNGIVGTARVEVVTAAYDASHLYEQPNYSYLNSAQTARVQPYGAVFMRMPLIRQTAHWGSQLIEPEVQIVASPNIGTSQNARIPNEDSLDLEFSDANLFSLNRYPGIDRLAGRPTRRLRAARRLVPAARCDAGRAARPVLQPRERHRLSSRLRPDRQCLRHCRPLHHRPHPVFQPDLPHPAQP